MNKTVKLYGAIGLGIVLVVLGGVVATRQFAPKGTGSITTVNGGQNVTTQSLLKPTVSSGRSWHVVLHEPNGQGGWVVKKLPMTAPDSVTMAQKATNALLNPLPGAESIFPAGTTAKVRIWDGILEIHLSNGAGGLGITKQEEADRIGMFTRTLIGPTNDFEDVRFYIGNKPVEHLFGSNYDTSQPFAQEPYAGVVGKR